MMAWIKAHKWIVIVGAVVILGLLLAIGTDTVSLPGQGGSGVD